mgnify:CR=1 FL=1
MTGVTTEVCVNTTVREANDRGYDCLFLKTAWVLTFLNFRKWALKMIKAPRRHFRVGLAL